jgi:hypothetical protein
MYRFLTFKKENKGRIKLFLACSTIVELNKVRYFGSKSYFNQVDEKKHFLSAKKVLKKLILIKRVSK